VVLHRKSILGLIAAAAVLFTALSAKASMTGSISGTVTDPSGAVLVGVKVTVTSVSTGIESSAFSDAKGFYRFTALSVDTYGPPFFNPNFFVQAPLGQIGDAMRRSFVGPRINNFNLALLKDTKIKDTKELQFRAEAFNVFNHAQFITLRANSTIPGKTASVM
jgi:hypothetical protein